MSCGAELHAGHLHKGITAQEVNGGRLVTFAAVETGHAAAHGLPGCHDALGTILAI